MYIYIFIILFFFLSSFLIYYYLYPWYPLLLSFIILFFLSFFSSFVLSFIVLIFYRPYPLSSSFILKFIPSSSLSLCISSSPKSSKMCRTGAPRGESNPIPFLPSFSGEPSRRTTPPPTRQNFEAGTISGKVSKSLEKNPKWRYKNW